MAGSRRVRSGLTIVALALAALSAGPLPGAAAADPAPGGTFLDDEGNIHEADIEAIAAAGITMGCNAAGFAFCPRDPVTRGEMAAFVRRALVLPQGSPTDHFSDDDGSSFEEDINALAAAGIAVACNPPLNNRFCPDRILSREEMAAFLARGFLPPAAEIDFFVDDAQSIFQEEINAIAAAGITLGCDAAGDRFCPADWLTRDQMASVLARARNLRPLPVATPLTGLAPGDSGAQVALLQSTLGELRLYRGPFDGYFGEQLASAVVAFHKLLWLERSEVWNAGDWALVGRDDFKIPIVRYEEPNRLEVDITRQLLFVVLDGELAAILPVSTGSGAPYISSSGNTAWSVTPRGDFTLFWYRPGWVYTRLGGIYNPWNFTWSFALHGYPRVPTYPASHGCVRVHVWDSDWLAGRLWVDIPFHVWDS